MCIQASKAMEHIGKYKTNCGFGSINARIRKIQPYIAEKGEVMEEEEEEEEAKSIGLEEEEDHEAKSMDVEEEEEKKHICCECGKGFKSGKALGGHKRIHVLETRKSSTMVKPKMMYGVASRSERDKVEVDCCVCHKKFTSMKALYGHMRFHPDRGWKGVMPPLFHPLGHSSASTLSVDHDDDDDDDDDDENSELWDNVVDLKESIKGGWSVTGKRGRRSVLKDVDAKNLLVLANTAEAANLNSAETYKEMNKKRRKKKRLCEMEKESSSTHHERQLEIVVEAEEGGGAREKHVCVTCNKSFTSYQALGGHRASHNKVKNHQASALLLGTEASPQGSNPCSNNGDHVCNICHKIFPTGQALGGHKRRHWAGPVSTEAATEARIAYLTAPAAASSSQRTEIMQEVIKPKRMFLEFDLNELPPNEEKEERV